MQRRVFLKAGGIAAVGFGALPRFVLRAAEAAEGARRRRVLVVVFQRGANDGLNTIVPHGDGAYYDARPSIAVPRPNGATDAALDLDGHFGLHPALAPLLPSWRDGRLAVVHAIGSPDATRSHFDAQDFMESGTPGRKATDDGWMNRTLLATPEPDATPLRAVSLTPELPRSLQGRAPAVAFARLRDFGVRPSAGASAARGFEGMYDAAVDGVLRGAGREAFEAMDALKAAQLAAGASTGEEAGYPNAPLGQALRQVALLVKADVGLELAFAEAGGWDTHAGQAAQQAARLRELGSALAAFQRDLGARAADVVLVTLTEFGRTVRENGNRGTDHGHGSVSLVLGGPVHGGRVRGHWPGLRGHDLYENRDLAVTTDFRALLAELLVRHVGVTDVASVFPGFDARPSAFPGVLRG
jgi:uncharacterized protein (DUF1501 family)